MKVVTRFAPSPTGLFHAGSYRTALFAYIFARQNDGKFILRIEDTDTERSKKEYEDNILESLKWLGLDYDAFYRQSERGATYRKYIDKLISEDKAYVSKEDPKEAGERGEVIRFRNPNRKIAFDDIVRGRVEFDTTELGDFVIAKSLTEPIFHLVNVIDDYEMGVTHIIRGEDHISNTPRQMLIFEAIGAKPPAYAHIPLLLGKDRSKMSKRHGAVAMTEYRDRGYLPVALVNYLSLLGWHPADDTEVMDLDAIITKFSLDRVQKSGAVFDEEKLRWFNREYISRLSDRDFMKEAQSFLPFGLDGAKKAAAALMPLLRNKISCFGDIRSLFTTGGELAFVDKVPAYDASLLLWKKTPDPRAAATHISKARELLADLADTEFDSESIKASIWPYAEASGRGEVLWPLRAALTGQERSPDPFVSAAILGKAETLARLDAAIAKLR